MVGVQGGVVEHQDVGALGGAVGEHLGSLGPQWCENDVVGEQQPGGPRPAELVGQPGFLPLAEEGSGAVVQSVERRIGDLLVAAVDPGVEEHEVDQVAVGDGAPDPRQTPSRTPSTAAGTVRVRPTGDDSPPLRNTYQYVVRGESPVTVTWTVWSASGAAAVRRSAPAGSSPRHRRPPSRRRRSGLPHR